VAVRLRDVVADDIPMFFEHQLDPEGDLLVRASVSDEAQHVEFAPARRVRLSADLVERLLFRLGSAPRRNAFEFPDARAVARENVAGMTCHGWNIGRRSRHLSPIWRPSL
jgi:hypothetical protein